MLSESGQLRGDLRAACVEFVRSIARVLVDHGIYDMKDEKIAPRDLDFSWNVKAAGPQEPWFEEIPMIEKTQVPPEGGKEEE
jgi:hypothetical protein